MKRSRETRERTAKPASQQLQEDTSEVVTKVRKQEAAAKESKPNEEKDETRDHQRTFSPEELETGLHFDPMADPTQFRRKVFAYLKKVPAGYFTSYGHLAHACGGGARAVGNALRHNPFAPIVPCHRVLRADFSLGGFSGATGDHCYTRKKLAILRKEGLSFVGDDTSKFAPRVAAGDRSKLFTFKGKQAVTVKDEDMTNEALLRDEKDCKTTSDR